MLKVMKMHFSYLTNVGSAHYVAGSMLSTRDTKVNYEP